MLFTTFLRAVDFIYSMGKSERVINLAYYGWAFSIKQTKPTFLLFACGLIYFAESFSDLGNWSQAPIIIL